MEAHIDSQEDTALLVDLLIEAGSAEVEATDIDGHTALHFCCLNGLTEAAKVLVCCHLSKTLVRTFLRKKYAITYITFRNTSSIHSYSIQKFYVDVGKNMFGLANLCFRGKNPLFSSN